MSIQTLFKIHDEHARSKRAVKIHLNACRAREERKRIQQREQMFERHHPYRFQSSHKQKVSCTKLLCEDKLVSDPDELASVWELYCKDLSTSQCSSNPQLATLVQKINSLEAYRTMKVLMIVLLPEHKTERHDPLHMKERSSSRTDFFIFDGVRSSEV